MTRRVGAELPARKVRTEWPITNKYAEALDTVPHDGDWYELARYRSEKYAYEVAASLRGKPMRAGKRPFPINGKRSDWEFRGQIVRAVKKNGDLGAVVGSALYARWRG